MLEPEFDPYHCSVCDSAAAELVFEHPGRSFTSDGRTVAADIRKVQCRACGAVRRGNPFTRDEQTRHYTSDYQLARRAEAAEPVFFCSEGPVPRSRAIADWFSSVLSTAWLAPDARVLEVGCGEGRLMAALAARWPGARLGGIDRAVAADRDGMPIRQGSYGDVDGTYDVIYSFAVMEHVASPVHFLATLGGRLTPRGVLAVGVPRLDAGPRDVLFCDHLHHLCSSHVQRMAARAGLAEQAQVAGSGPLAEFGLHVFTSAPGTREDEGRWNPQICIDVHDTIAKWRRRWQALDAWLQLQTARPLMVWGVGETFGILSTYSSLGDCDIACGLDDNPRRFTAAFSFPVRRPDDVAADLRRAAVLLTFSPGALVRQRLEAFGCSWFDAITGEAHSC